MLLMRTLSSPGVLAGPLPTTLPSPICVSQSLSWPPTHYPRGDTSFCHTLVYLVLQAFHSSENGQAWETRALVMGNQSQDDHQ